MSLIAKRMDQEKENIQVNNLRFPTGGLDLSSTATQQRRKELLLWFHRSTHRGMIDKHPVLVQHAEPEALIDHKRLT